MPKSRPCSLKFIALLAWSLLSACSGKLYILAPATDDACANISCPDNYFCKAGTCISTGLACNAINTSGICNTGDVCVQGACYAADETPAKCSASVSNGLCGSGMACLSGGCVALTASNVCTAQNPNGLCQGGSTCVQGWCYADNNIACSQSQPNGYCATGQSCINGTCKASAPQTCNASNFGGTCLTAWQTCAEGECIGPVPPSTLACSTRNPLDPTAPYAPAGICPSQEVQTADGSFHVSPDVCVAGVCTPTDNPNAACSFTNPTGLCPPAAGCQQGKCVAINTDNTCSALHLAGLCPGGATCVQGVCQEAACGEPGGWQCQTGQYCTSGVCQQLPTCDPVHPGAFCPSALEVCTQGVCNLPTCSSSNLNGTCEGDGHCDPNGRCVGPACTLQDPNGTCSDATFACVAGACVKRACSSRVLDGSCTGNSALATVSDPYFGAVSVAATCCDASLSSATGCQLGTCAAPACSTNDANTMHGVCPDASADYCYQGVCTAAPCTPFFQNGTCDPNSPDQCARGRCTKINCIGQDANYCAPGSCDTNQADTLYYNTCVLPGCTPATPEGTCPSGSTCCDPNLAAAGDPNCTGSGSHSYGQCIAPACSTAFPGGSCPGGEICAGGVCSTPPCGSRDPNGNFYPNGNCGPNFACNINAVPPQCQIQACSPLAPAGTCPRGQTCVNGANFVGDPNYGHCEPFTCSDYYPTAPCPIGEVCNKVSGHYVCQTPACDPNHLGGFCAAPLICASGVCITPACSSAFTTGACPASQICCDPTTLPDRGCANPNLHVAGTCIQAACSASNTRGYCGTNTVCCDPNLLAVSYPGCTRGAQGSCLPEVCSPSFLAGPCPANQICITGTCETPCSAAAPLGWCPPLFACTERACAPTCAHDQDCDNISDTAEGLNPNNLAGSIDTDADGSPDGLDRDADNDRIPDEVEKGCNPQNTNVVCTLATTPLSTNGVLGDWRNPDSDSDNISDLYEAGPAPTVPRDTDGDGVPDYRDIDSDNDGVWDLCEAWDTLGPCQINNPNHIFAIPVDTNHDGKEDYRDLDSDSDGVTDHIENRTRPADNSTFNPNHIVDHDHDNIPDLRDLDSDSDGVSDKEEDANGDGLVNCQLGADGNFVLDPRTVPLCGSTSTPFSGLAPYDFNPGCALNNKKCLFSETNRVFSDTNGNGIQDNQDGIFEVCGTKNLKAVNLFYSQTADYAFALETSYNKTIQFSAPNNVGDNLGMAFDDINTDPNTINGSWAVSGFIANRVVTAVDNANDYTLVQKAIIQAQADGGALSSTAANTAAVSLVINRNSTSFDGFGAVTSRYRLTTSADVPVNQLRDNLVNALVGTTSFSSGVILGPTAHDFTLNMQTLYRSDDTFNATVMTVVALTPTGVNAAGAADQTVAHSYNYRVNCTNVAHNNCNGSTTPGCTWNGTTCVERGDYQIPLFFASNVSDGSSLTRYGNDLASLCQSLVQSNGPLDFIWVVDDSISMAPEIGQVVNASNLFFGLLNNSEADYRVGMVTTAPSIDSAAPLQALRFKPQFPGCYALPRPKCEQAANAPGSGGCSWDIANNVCAPICTPFTSQGECLRSGCAWEGGACAWGGCDSVNTYAQNANTFCANAANNSNSTCSAAGCVWTGSACAANNCSGFNDSASCSNHHCEWYNGSQCQPWSNIDMCLSQMGCFWNGATSTCGLGSLADRSNGSIVGGFTGAVGGIYNTSALDRSSTYECAQGCAIDAGGGSTVCSAQNKANCANYPQCTLNPSNPNQCVSNCCDRCIHGPNSPTDTTPFTDSACYFASRLPPDNGNGWEYGLLMAEWAMYRSGAPTLCTAVTDPNTCALTPGCTFDKTVTPNTCVASYCAIILPNNSDGNGATDPVEQCSGNNPYYTWAAGNNYDADDVAVINSLNVAHGADPNRDEESPMGCEYSYENNACMPSMGRPCGNFDSTTCPAPRCKVALGSCVPAESVSQVLCNGQDSISCLAQAPGWCQWDSCGTFATASTCTAMYGCGWSGTACTGPGSCHPPLDHAFRANATKVAVVLSDEEECYLKDGSNGGAVAYDGACEWKQYNGGVMNYNDTVRISRTNAYLGSFVAHGFTTYALVGDKADASLGVGPSAAVTCPAGCYSPPFDPAAPAQIARCVAANDHNVLCPTRLNGGCYNPIPNGPLVQAEPGQAYINVAEGTGGGWGSICATNLYPSIEATVIASLSQSSPYKLYTFAHGAAVQPISSTLQVAVQTCSNSALYPGCGGAANTQVLKVPRSRSNGFDYDPINNTVVLYGSYRAFTSGDVVVNYRYWLNNDAVHDDADCPCPGTSAPGCACPAGEACGIGGSNSNPIDHCTGIATDVSCAVKPGCIWNTANGGFCEATGICRPDPTCGGACPSGETCNATTGLCECDTGCGAGCNPGSTCDADPLSTSCGKCLCDVSCGGGCPAGQACQTSGSECGLCTCILDCGVCQSNQQCNNDPNSATCGLCLSKACPASCPSGEVCDPASGTCVCDTTCGGGCNTGTTCDSSLSSSTCGQCLCDPHCGGVTCAAGTVCDSDLAHLSTCGRCVVDPTCGNQACAAACTSGTVAGCNADANCLWEAWRNNSQGACAPVVCRACSTTTGSCLIDPTCNACGGCGPAQVCDSPTGTCVCDTTCGGSCATGQTCDTNPNSATCGQCECDLTCGGTCPSGDVCDTGGASPTCGQCIIDVTCGGHCPYPFVCNPTTGLCAAPPCGGCPQGYSCDSASLKCQPTSE